MQQHWYRSSHNAVTFSLLPLSWLFRSTVSVRRFLYRAKFKKSYRLPVPVIVVGNITVGGTGKTPFVIWLAHFLKSQGLKPGIVTRGVGGKQQRSPRKVEKNSDPALVGDEAILLVNRSQCPVVIGIDRVAAAKELLSECDIIISDDGLQHYRLERDIEIALIDGARGLGNQSFLPAGPLRESSKRLKEVDFVVVHGEGEVDQSRQIVCHPESAFCSKDHSGYNDPSSKKRSQDDKLLTGFAPISPQFSMHLQGDTLISLLDEQKTFSINHFQKVHAVAGIGNPQRFFASLRAQGLNIIEHIFPDHYLYQAKDFDFNDQLPVIMTEKDAVKCQRFADERFWYLPVEMQIDSKFEIILAEKLRAC